MSISIVYPLERGKGAPKHRAVTVTRQPLTPEELDACWYCQHCSEPMREDDDGFVDPQSRLSFCSEKCRDDYAAEGWWGS